MRELPTDKTRERRITMEIVVDAYTENERAMGWYSRGPCRFLFGLVASGGGSPLLCGEAMRLR
jgi:hypothetical protein